MKVVGGVGDWKEKEKGSNEPTRRICRAEDEETITAILIAFVFSPNDVVAFALYFFSFCRSAETITNTRCWTQKEDDNCLTTFLFQYPN